MENIQEVRNVKAHKDNIFRNLDPRTKILMALLVNIPFFSNMGSPYLYILVGYVLLLLIGAREHKMVVKLIILYGFCSFFQWVSPYIPEFIVITIGTTIVGVTLFLPLIIFGIFIARTTSVNDIAVVLDQMKAPDAVVIPSLVIFRYLPTIKVERKAISNAMKLRGINFGIRSLVRNPVKTVEYLYVPLLFSLVKSGEELTVAALTRGLGGDEHRTHLKEIHPRLWDGVVFAIFIGLVVVTLII